MTSFKRRKTTDEEQLHRILQEVERYFDDPNCKTMSIDMMEFLMEPLTAPMRERVVKICIESMERALAYLLQAAVISPADCMLGAAYFDHVDLASELLEHVLTGPERVKVTRRVCKNHSVRVARLLCNHKVLNCHAVRREWAKHHDRVPDFDS